MASSLACPAGAFGWIGLRPPVTSLGRFVVYIGAALRLWWTVFPSRVHRAWVAYQVLVTSPRGWTAVPPREVQLAIPLSQKKGPLAEWHGQAIHAGCSPCTLLTSWSPPSRPSAVVPPPPAPEPELADPPQGDWILNTDTSMYNLASSTEGCTRCGGLYARTGIRGREPPSRHVVTCKQRVPVRRRRLKAGAKAAAASVRRRSLPIENP